MPSQLLTARAESSSEAVSLKGKPAKTPIIAGSVCGGVMGIAWIIGFAIYFRKRMRRKKREAMEASGPALPRRKSSNRVEEKFIIPPDPAVLLGQRQPGEHAFPNDDPDHPSRPTPLASRASSQTRTPIFKHKASSSEILHQTKQSHHYTVDEGAKASSQNSHLKVATLQPGQPSSSSIDKSTSDASTEPPYNHTKGIHTESAPSVG